MTRSCIWVDRENHPLEGSFYEGLFVKRVLALFLFLCRLLLDSRDADLPMAYNPTLVILSSLKPFFFNSFKNETHFSDNIGA